MWDRVYVPTDRAPAPERSAPVEPDGPPEPTDDVVTVFLPTQAVDPAEGEFLVEMRHDVDGRLALLVYSSLETLIEACGHFQPWAGVPAANVEDIRATTGAEVVLLDEALDPQWRHGPTSEEPTGGEGA